MCHGTIERNAGPRFQAYTRSLDIFRNANNGQYNNVAQPEAAQPSQGGLSLSREAFQMMGMMTLMSAMMGGDFGFLLNMLSSFGQMARGAQQAALPGGHPGFGERGAGECAGAHGSHRAHEAAHAQQASEVGGPRVAAGQTRELKEGESVRGANGTQLTWGQGDNVDIKYRDKNGQTKSISVKDGMISFDGGTPRKLGNTGQLLKLPNGDVIGLGNQNDSKGGKDLCRVVMADNADKVVCQPNNATNIYDVEALERRYTSMEGGGISMNVTSSSYQTPYGMVNTASASMQVFMGVPVTRAWTEQNLHLAGAK